MKKLVALIFLAAPVAVMAADDPDSSFYKDAAEAGMYEVDAGQMAADKGSSQSVKDFGAKMVKDHGAANDKLKALAASKGVSLPTTASVGELASEAKLKIESGDTFDKGYISSQIKAHRAAVKLFKTESTTGQDAEAKAFATATLPTLHAHLKMIDGIAKEAGVSTK